MIRKVKKNKSHSGLVEQIVDTPDLSFTAYFDSSEKNLLFVIDQTPDSITPSARLIIQRSNKTETWDDLIAKKYKVDLEKIRPKKGHLYQPLDIEYENLHLYKTYLKDPEKEINRKNLILNREKQALNHTIKRLDEQTDVLHKSQQTVMSSRKSVQDYSERLDRLKSRQKAQAKKKKEAPKSVKPEQEARLTDSLDRTNEGVKSRRKRLRRAEKRVEKAKEKIAAIKERLHQIKERLKVYKKEQQEEKKEVKRAPIIIEKEVLVEKEPIKPTPLPHTPRHHHPWDIELSERQIHIFHIMSFILIGLLILFFIVLRVRS